MSLLSSILSLLKSPKQSETKPLESSASSASSPAQSQGSSSNPHWISHAIDQIRADEGEVLHAYEDHLGYLTIGIGRLIDKRKGGGISSHEATYLLQNDITTRASALRTRLPWFEHLDGARKSVLLNMSFQMGVAGLMKFKKTLAKVESGDYEGAASNMLKSKWARQTPARAKRMAEQMRTGKWVS